jgi:TPR repeat protein
LAQAYLLGEKGLKPSAQDAARWAEKSADQFNGDAEAMLAGFYLDGVGVPNVFFRAAVSAAVAEALHCPESLETFCNRQ